MTTEPPAVTDPSIPVLIELPREGYAVYFREDKHWYQRVNPQGKPGTRLPGGSTIGGAFPDRPDGLMKWAARTDREGIARLIQSCVRNWPDLDEHERRERLERLGQWTDPYALFRALESHGLHFDQVRGQAADRGKGIHEKMLEALARGDEVPDLDVLDEDERGYGQAVFRWWQARKPTALHVEQVVLSNDHGYAGRFDLSATVDDPMGMWNGVGVVDLKTGNAVYRSDHVQLRCYCMAAVECGLLERVDWAMLLQVCPDGSYIEHPCAASERAARLAIDSYAEAKVVDKAMKGAK